MGLVIQGVLRFKVYLGFCLIMSMEMPFLPSFFFLKKKFSILYIYIYIYIYKTILPCDKGKKLFSIP
jgi:hypothetical protein